MKTIIKKAFSILLVSAVLLTGIPVMTALASGVTPLSVADYNSDTNVYSYANRTSNLTGSSIIYGNRNTFGYNANGNAVDITVTSIGSGYDGNYVYTFFGNPLDVISTTDVYIAILYKTTSSNLITGNGFYASDLVGNVVASAKGRPNFATQTLVIEGESFYLALAELNMSATSIDNGQRIRGVRFNLTKASIPYSFYGIGVFSSAEDAVTYFSTDETSPVFPDDQEVTLSRIGDSVSTVVSWEAATDNLFDMDTITYRVFAAPAAITAENLGSATVIANVTGTATATVNNLTPSTAYYFAVEAADPSGNTAVWYGSDPLTTPKRVITPRAIVRYNSNSNLKDWDHKALENGERDFIGGQLMTASISENANAVSATATSLGNGNYVYLYFNVTNPAFSVLSGNSYTFAILYRTESNILISGKGFIASNRIGNAYTNDNQRPVFATQTITVNGENYYLATATLDMDSENNGIASGTVVHGLRVGIPTANKEFDFYGAGAFSTEEDAITYFSTDETSPAFPNGQEVTLAQSGDTTSTVVSWEAATDDLFDADAITYRVFAASAAITAETLGSATVIATVTGITTATVRNLIANTGYYFAVEAADAAGNTVMWYGDSPVTSPKLAVAPRAIVRYNGQSVLKDWAHKSESVAGGLITGNSTTASVNVTGTAVEAVTTSSADGYFVCMNFDQRISALTAQSPYTFAFLYQTDGTLINNQGFFSSTLVGDAMFKAGGSGVHVRPQLTTQPITINGESYYLATTTLDMTNGEIANGAFIYGLRVNIPQTNKTYSFYSAGCFYTEEDAISYYQAQVIRGVSTPLALMHCTADDDNGYKASGVTTMAKGGSVWIGGTAEENTVYSYHQGKGALQLRSTQSSTWIAPYLDRAYIPKSDETFYIALLYETDDGQGEFSSATKGYCYKNNSFLPIVDGTTRFSFSYIHDFEDSSGKTYSIAYAPISDAEAGVDIYGFQIAIKENTNYYLHSAGVFRDMESIQAYYFDFEKTSQKELEDFDELLAPYWKGDTVYEESVMVLTEEDGSIAPISLLYPIDSILKVTDATKSVQYVAGRDYSMSDGKLVICEGTSIPVTDYDEYYFDNNDDNLTSRKLMADGSGRYTYFAEGRYWHFRQILVTYEHSGTWKGDIPTGKTEKLPKTMEKLRNGEALSVIVNGYSNTTGCNVSSSINAQPFLPNYADMTIAGLKQKFHNDNITMVNTAVGGTLAVWANENVQTNIIDYHPDLIFIEQGLNDPELNAFRTNMTAMVAKIKSALPDCEIVLIQSTMPNPDVSGHYAHQDAYVNVLNQIANSYEGIVVANVGTEHDYMLSIKKYCDMTGNNVNHVNDFLERLYAQVLLKVFDDEEETLNVTAPLAYARYTQTDAGSIKPAGSYFVEAGSAWAGGDSSATIEFDEEKCAVHILGSGVWAGLQFDNVAVSTGRPYYAAVLYSTSGNVYNRFSNTAGHSYVENVSTSFMPSTQAGRLKWRYDYVGSANGNDYYMGYYRVTDVAANTSLNGIQVTLNSGVDYYFYAAGLFDTYAGIKSAFKEAVQFFVGNTLTLQGDIGVNFFCHSDWVSSSSSVSFTWGEKTSGPIAVSDFDTVTVGGNSCYKFSCNVSAKEMNQVITATVRTNGNVVATQTATVAEFAQYYLDDEGSSDSLKNLMTSMLNYGAKAQRYFQYDVENLAIDDYDPPAVDWNDLPTENSSGVAYKYKTGDNAAIINNSNLAYLGNSVVLQGTTSLRLFFNVNGEAGSVTDANGTELPYVDDEGGFRIYTIANIVAADLLKDITVLFDGEAVPFNVVTYLRSTLKKYESSEDAGEQALYTLIQSLYDYNQKAIAHFG